MKSYHSSQAKVNRQMMVNEFNLSATDKLSSEHRRESMLKSLRLMRGDAGVSNAQRTSFHSSPESRKRMSLRKGSLAFSNGFSDIKEETATEKNSLESPQQGLRDVRVYNTNNNVTSSTIARTKTMLPISDDALLISETNELVTKDRRTKGSVLIKIDEFLGVESKSSNGEVHRQQPVVTAARRGSLMHKLRDSLQSQTTDDKPKSRNGRRGSTLSRLQDVVFDVRGGVTGPRRGSTKTNGTGFLATGLGVAQSSFKLHFQLKKLRQRNREKRLRKFRSSAKIIIFLYRLCKTHYLSANDRGTATRGLVVDDEQKELLFDVTYFKANRKAGISSDAKRILTTSAHERTDKEKYHCLISLRNYKTFSEYPLAMQQAIVQCAWYETYSAKRVILRQGHQPHNFYFILSGSVLVNVLEQGSLYAKTVVYLHKGETFGELAIVNKAQRQSTIIAREGIELLCIDADNYVQIFMAGGISSLFDSENDFVKNLKFLDGWPLHLLVGNRKKCVFSYFMRGDVLIKNSKTTDWILIVKSGSCSVMKRLKEVKQTQSYTRRVSISDGKGFPDHMRRRKRLSLFPGMEKVAGRSFENFEQRKRREEFENFLNDLNTNELYANNRKRVLGGVNKNDSKRVSFQQGEAEKEEGTDRRRSSGIHNAATKTYKNRRSSTLPLSVKKPHLERRRANQQSIEEGEAADDEEDNTSEADDEEAADDNDPLKRFYQITGDAKVTTNSSQPSGKRKTMVDEVIDTNLDQENAEDGVKHIWVTVQTLTKGSVFGLAELAFGLQPSFAVVSNGAECILLSKKLYLEHVDSHMMTKLRTEEYPYPTDEEMQAQLEVEMKWEEFRIGTLKKTVNIKNAEKSSKRSLVDVGV
ncbi:uncharacterized protein [Antedon mediterranea]|uniref:uncharacterized protein n=1 Tax=Antedon mediterranea TaxID=105859 RepID=UPI003AF664B3